MLVHLLEIEQLGCRFDIMDSISSFFCILTYAIIYVLILNIIFWLYLYFLDIVTYFFTYSCTNIFHRRSLYTFNYPKKWDTLRVNMMFTLRTCEITFLPTDIYNASPNKPLLSQVCAIPFNSDKHSLINTWILHDIFTFIFVWQLVYFYSDVIEIYAPRCF